MQGQQISNKSANVSFENFTTMAVKIAVSWYVTPCILAHRYRCSTLTHYLILQGTINRSGTLVPLTQTTRHYIQTRVVSISVAARFSFPREKSYTCLNILHRTNYRLLPKTILSNLLTETSVIILFFLL